MSCPFLANMVGAMVVESEHNIRARLPHAELVSQINNVPVDHPANRARLSHAKILPDGGQVGWVAFPTLVKDNMWC